MLVSLNGGDCGGGKGEAVLFDFGEAAWPDLYQLANVSGAIRNEKLTTPIISYNILTVLRCLLVLSQNFPQMAKTSMARARPLAPWRPSSVIHKAQAFYTTFTPQLTLQNGSTFPSRPRGPSIDIFRCSPPLELCVPAMAEISNSSSAAILGI